MKKIDALTGVRAFAAYWLALMHFNNLEPLAGADFGFAELFVSKGWFGVDMFFVLSGFIISYVHGQEFATFDRKTLRAFLVARLARIYPVHVVMLLVFAALYVAAVAIGGHEPESPEKYTLSAFALNLALLHAWGFTDIMTWNYVSWSISAEWFAYLLFPIIALALARVRGWRISALLIAVTLTGVTVVVNLSPNQSINGDVANALFRVGVEFFVGCCLYSLYRNGFTRRRVNWDLVAAAAFVGMTASIYARLNDAVTLLFIAAFIFALVSARGPVAKALSWRPVVYLGEISYSVYMAHAAFEPLAKAFARRVGYPDGAGWGWLGLALLLAAATAAGALLFHFVERPARGYLRRRFAAPRPAAERTRAAAASSARAPS